MNIIDALGYTFGIGALVFLGFGLVQGLEEEWGDFYVPEILSLGPLVAWPIKPCDLPHAGRRT